MRLTKNKIEARTTKNGSIIKPIETMISQTHKQTLPRAALPEPITQKKFHQIFFDGDFDGELGLTSAGQLNSNVKSLNLLVGVAGFEPTTPTPPV